MSTFVLPTTFPPRPSTTGRLRRMVVGCTFDPLGLQGPLSVWLDQVTGLRCEIQWLPYGVVTESISDMNGGPWNQNNSDMYVLFLRFEDLLRDGDTIIERAAGTAHPGWDLIEALRRSCKLRRRGAATLVVLAPIPSPKSSTVSSFGSCVEADLEETQRLTAALCAIDGLRVLDEPAVRDALGPRMRYHSAFLDRVAHAPYSPSGCSTLAGLVVRELARSCSPKRKVYCLDCDNTLWGGAVGELGPHGVSMAEPFLDVQRRFVARQRRGALLCLVSRNEEADVRAVLQERRDEMVLHDEHVVAIRANWQPKSANLLELAATLCLDPASFVFVDDSPAECAEVAASTGGTGIGVVRVPRDPSAIASHLDHAWFLHDEFEAASTANADGADSAAAAGMTEEDTRRTTLYRELDERKAFVCSSAASAASMDAFTASLHLRIGFAPLAASNADRAAQLTDRTNQHNACKWPIKPAGLIAATTGLTAVTVDARDRFGHHGMVGLIVLDTATLPAIVPLCGKDGATAAPPPLLTASPSCPAAAAAAAAATAPPPCAMNEAASSSDEVPSELSTANTAVVLHVRCWLLSCRSLHLGIEYTMMRHAAAIATARGATHLGFHWLTAERNEPAAAFLFSLPGVGFANVSEEASLGLQPLEERAAEATLTSQDCTPPGGLEVVDGQHTASRSHYQEQLPVAQNTVEQDVRPQRGAELKDVTPASVEEVTERIVRVAIETGRRLTLADLPPADSFAAMPAVARKLLTRRLGALMAKARTGDFKSGAVRSEMALMIRGRIGGELCRHTAAGGQCIIANCPFVHRMCPTPLSCTVELTPAASSSATAVDARDHVTLRLGFHAAQARHAGAVASAVTARAAAAPSPPAKQRDPTYGQISQYKREATRPKAGIILVPVASAAAAAVSFNPRAGQRVADASPPSAPGSSLDVASMDSSSGVPAERPGYQSSKAVALHYETVDQLAVALSTEPDKLHAWVASESERAHELPDAFKEVWAQYERRDREKQGEAAPDGKPPDDDDESGLDVETLHARLRRRMRHSMHVMMQESNPDSYYKDVVHPERVD